MTVQQMKDAISRVYNTASWRRKVANMYDDQVIAIYRDFSHRGVLDKVLRNERPQMFEKQKPKEEYQQLTMFDFLKENNKRGIK